MATPVDFTESNLTIHGPQGPEDPDVLAVRARRLEGAVVTYWRFDADELAEIAATGGAWLSVWGNTMPPALVTGRKADVI